VAKSSGEISPGGDKDRSLWNLTEKGVYCKKSTYAKLDEVWVKRSFKHLRKAKKIP
jgi:hypothetical protein